MPRTTERPFAERIKELVAARDDLSISKLRFEAYNGEPGTNPETTKKALAGERPLTPIIIEAFAQVLDVPPEDFIEYRLALMRESLDERRDFAGAVEQLKQIESALQAAGLGERPAREQTRTDSATGQ